MSSRLNGSNVNILDEHEWRTIHNALSIMQAQTGSVEMPIWVTNEIQRLQDLMDKIRDNYIAPYVQETP